jgi:hypothetical protein
MKKITLLLVILLASVIGSYGQCLDAVEGLYPAATYTPATCDGSTVNSITTAGWASEYSNVNVTLGETYTFTSSVATDFITIGSADGLTAIAFGENGTLTWIADVTDVVRFYTHLDNACGAAQISRTRGIICGTPPTCPKPLNVAVSGITTTSADFTWDAGGSETEWEVLVLPNGDPAPDAATAGTPISGSSTYQATSLNDSTAYQFYVRANCGGGDFSTWTAATNFATSCVAITDITENFDAALAFPTCWSRVGTLGGANVQASAAAPSAPNVLYLYGTSAAAQGMVAMPPVSNAGAGTHRLKFKARSNFTVGGVIEVGYLTDIADAATFVSLQSFTTTSTTVFDTFIANLGTDPGANEVLAFRHSGAPAYSVLIDDVAWEPVPMTLPSCASNFVATIDPSCGNFATQLTWDAATDADGYNLTIGTTAGGNDILDAQNIGGATSYSYSGTFNTTYYYKVIPFNFVGNAAGCTEESFTTFATGCYCTSLPTSNDGSGITNVQIGPIDFPTADVTYVDNTATPVDLAQGISNNVQISFATGFTYGTNIWIDFNDNLTFDDTELVFSGTSLATNPTIFDASFVVPADATLGNHRMRIGTADSGQATPNPCFSGTYGVTLDFLANITPQPSCLAPTLLIASDVTSSTAIVSWTESASTPANGYEYFISTTNAVPLATDTATGSVSAGITVVDLINLSPASTYYVWVRSLCSNTDTSAWSSSVTFATACATVVPLYIQDFATFAPACWSRAAAGDVTTGPTGTANGIWAADGFLNVGTTEAIKVNLYSLNRIGWMISPTADLSLGNYSVSFDYGVTTWNATTASAMGSDDTVQLLISEDDGATWTVLTTFDASSAVAETNQTFAVNLSSVSSSAKFAFVATDGIVNDAEDYDFFIDNFKIDIGLANTTFDKSNFTYYPNPVKDVLNLSYTNNISNVAVFNLIGQQMSSKTVKANHSKVDMSNLASGTYLVKVTSDNQVKTIKVIKE